MKKIIRETYNKCFNKNSRKNKKNRIENLFYKLEELNNIKAQLINEKQIRIKKIEFDLTDIEQEIKETEKELNIAILSLDSNINNDEKNDKILKHIGDRNLSFRMEETEN